MQHKDNFDMGREVFVREWLIKVRFCGRDLGHFCDPKWGGGRDRTMKQTNHNHDLLLDGGEYLYNMFCRALYLINTDTGMGEIFNLPNEYNQ